MSVRVSRSRAVVATWSRNDPVTLFGAAVTKNGWGEIGPTLEWLASRFSNCESFEYEVIAAGASGDLAYIVGIERTTARVGDAAPWLTRCGSPPSSGARTVSGKSSTATAIRCQTAPRHATCSATSTTSNMLNDAGYAAQSSGGFVGLLDPLGELRESILTRARLPSRVCYGAAADAGATDMLEGVTTSAVLAVAVLLAGCSSGASSPPAAHSLTEASPSPSSSPSNSGEPRGCVPACIKGLIVPGDVGPGPYTTQFFFGGRMDVMFEGPWTSGEDSTGEFNAMPNATPQNGVFFWEDVYPVRDGNRVQGVPLTAAGLLSWLQSTPALETSAPKTGRIGTLPATVVDVSVSGKAKNEDPNCPTRACVLFLSFPQWIDRWGIAYTQVQRFYLSDVEYGGVKHLFVAVIYPDKGPDLKTFATVGERLLGTVRVPATPA